MNNRINMDAICRKALQTYGSKAQICMVFEEFSELQKELCKNLRGKDNLAQIAEEIADVRIVLRQMEILFDCREAVAAQEQRKLERLELRIGSEGGIT